MKAHHLSAFLVLQHAFLFVRPSNYPNCFPVNNTTANVNLDDTFCDMNMTSPGFNTAACGWDGGDCCESTCFANHPSGCSNSAPFNAYECLDPAVIGSTVRIIPTSGDLTVLAPSSGRVEVFHNDEWGLICRIHWDIIDGDVVCRQLGFTGIASIPPSSQTNGGFSYQKFWMQNVTCVGMETTLESCLTNGWGATGQCAPGTQSLASAQVSCSNAIPCEGVQLLVVGVSTISFQAPPATWRLIRVQTGSDIVAPTVWDISGQFKSECLAASMFTPGHTYRFVIENLQQAMTQTIDPTSAPRLLVRYKGVDIYDHAFNIPAPPPLRSHEFSFVIPTPNPSSSPTKFPTHSTTMASVSPTTSPAVAASVGGANLGGTPTGQTLAPDTVIALAVIGALVGICICGMAIYAFYRRSVFKVKTLEYVAPAAGIQLSPSGSAADEILQVRKSEHLTPQHVPAITSVASVSSDYKSDEYVTQGGRSMSPMVERYITPQDQHPYTETEGGGVGTAVPQSMEGAGEGSTGGARGLHLPHRSGDGQPKSTATGSTESRPTKYDSVEDLFSHEYDSDEEDGDVPRESTQRRGEERGDSMYQIPQLPPIRETSDASRAGE